LWVVQNSLLFFVYTNQGVLKINDRHQTVSWWAKKIEKKMKNYDVIKILNFWKFQKFNDIWWSKIDIKSLNRSCILNKSTRNIYLHLIQIKAYKKY